MARPSTRQGLIDYALRALGHPVIQINVDDDQLEDRVDDAIQFFQEYHFDGIEKVFLKYQVTQDDLNNGYVSLISPSTNPFISSPGVSGNNETTLAHTEVGQSGSSSIQDLIVSVLQVFHFSQSSSNIFDIRYQFTMNDLYAFGAIDLQNYVIAMQYYSLLQQILSPDKAVRFNRKGNKLYIDMNWAKNLKAGDYLIIEAYRIMDPRVAPEVYNDILLKKYVTALFKRQWASNLSKFQNVQLLGGVTMNATELYNQAQSEIDKVEIDAVKKHSEPPMFFMG